MPRDTLLKMTFCLVLLLLLCQTALARTPDRHALLIGIDDYSTTPFRSLKGAVNDINLIRDVLEKHHGFKPEHITVLLNEKATHLGIRDAFRALGAQAEPGDLIYIHYSGHGSSACDLNGDEGNDGLDSTWVPYGSRSEVRDAYDSKDCDLTIKRGVVSDEVDLNQYDILDDELNQWVAALNAVTENVVFVSDSCHSGTVSKSFELLPTRGVVNDYRAYPQASVSAPLEGVRISACRDDEKAGEFRDGNRVHGMFSWFWAKALAEAEAGLSWHDLVKRASAFIGYEYGGIAGQHPQIQGDIHRQAFGGDNPSGRRTVAVIDVVGADVTLGAGLLSGITIGSVYHNAKKGGEVRIESVEPTTSRGVARGGVEVGDLFVLQQYVPDMAPLGVCVEAREPAGAIELESARREVSQPGYVLADKGACDLRLVIESDESSDGLVCRILRSDGTPFCANSEAASISVEKGWESILHKRLSKMGRLRSLLGLQAKDKQAPLVFEAVVWQPGSDGEQTRTMGGFDYSYGQRYEEEAVAKAQVGDVLSFVIRNLGDEPYYSYLVSLSDDGSIIPFFPRNDDGLESGRVEPGATFESSSDFVYQLNKEGREYVRFIASREPVDIGLLAQEPFGTRSKSLGLFGRWVRAASLFEGEWTTDIIAFDIAPR